MDRGKTIVLKKIEGAAWRAYVNGGDHVGGTGATPEEAIGFLCLNHPQRMGIGEYRWTHEPPQMPGHPTEVYPDGVQVPFD